MWNLWYWIIFRFFYHANIKRLIHAHSSTRAPWFSRAIISNNFTHYYQLHLSRPLLRISTHFSTLRCECIFIFRRFLQWTGCFQVSYENHQEHNIKNSKELNAPQNIDTSINRMHAHVNGTMVFAHHLLTYWSAWVSQFINSFAWLGINSKLNIYSRQQIIRDTCEN